MARLKGVIFGVENVLIKPSGDPPNIATLEDTGKLVRFLRNRGVEPVVMTNREWEAPVGGTMKPLQGAIKAAWGIDISWYQ
jgi:hypothetical protein